MWILGEKCIFVALYPGLAVLLKVRFIGVAHRKISTGTGRPGYEAIILLCDRKGTLLITWVLVYLTS